MRVWLFIVLSLAIVASARAECQYVVDEVYAVNETGLALDNSAIKYANPLQLSDFTSSLEQSAFTVFNPNNFTIFAKFTFTVSGHGAGEAERGVSVPPNDYAIVKHYCYDGETRGECAINPASVTYFVARPELLFLKDVKALKTRTVCKDCAGSPCLDDWATCANDRECGSGNCPFTKVCTPLGALSFCPEGLVNCNNQSCLRPHIKKGGESYFCVDECISGDGDGKICSRSMREWGINLTIVGVLLIIFLIAIWKALVKVREGVAGVDELQELLQKIELAKKDFEHAKQQADRMKQQISKLKEKILGAEGAARVRYAEELTKLEESYDERRDELKERAKEIGAQEKALENEQDRLDGKYRAALIREYSESQIKVNSAGYPVFADSGKPIHVYRYEHRIGAIPAGYHVHHIDHNKMNFYDWNLIAIPVEDHKSIPHGKIPRGSWEKGIDVLLKALRWTEQDLPQHVRKHLHDA